MKTEHNKEWENVPINNQPSWDGIETGNYFTDHHGCWHEVKISNGSACDGQSKSGDIIYMIGEYPELTINQTLYDASESEMDIAGERWNSGKLGTRVEYAINVGWITRKGKLSKLGAKIAESKWNDLSLSAKNVLTKRIKKDYPSRFESGPETIGQKKPINNNQNI